MLWMKNWLETRLRFTWAVGFLVFVFTLMYVTFSRAPRNPHNPIPPTQQLAMILSIYSLFWVVPSAMMAGAGIKTQAPFQAMKGLHGSMHFTLSLPVSRRRLFFTRAFLGMLQLTGVILAACFGLWILLPAQFSTLHFSALDMVRYGLTALTCTAVFFSVSTLFATFLDDMWQVWGSFLVIGLLRGLSAIVPIPEKVDLFGALAGSSPLITHTTPWSVVALSLAATIMLYIAAARIVQTRDY